jgi:two-component system, OmpR family, sensor kinase
MSLRRRLVLGVLGLASVALVTADVATYTQLRSFLFQRTDRSLDAAHRVVEHAQHPGDLNALSATAPGMYLELRNPETNEVLDTLGPLRRFGQKAGAPPKLPEAIHLSGQAGPGQEPVRYFNADATSGSSRYRVRASLDPGVDGMLIVASSLDDVDGTLNRLLLVELLVTGGVLVAIALLGLWIVRLGLRPLDAIATTADEIAAGDLTRRVERAEERTEVGRLGLALNAMLGQIEAAFKAREASEARLRRFVADASHELRTPLAGVRAYAELFKRGADKRPADLARAMEGISRESERMSVLVQDLLLLARLDEGRPLEQEPVELDEIAREAVETARTVEPERPIELEVEPTVVLGDRERLRQAVDNLLGNVRSHTPPTSPATVSVSRENGHALLEVRDSGPGLTEEAAQRVFERFWRADPTRSRTRGGVGLGLSIVSAVADAHGGSASAHSEAGQGAVFRITLPLAPADSQPAPRASTGRAGSMST